MSAATLDRLPGWTAASVVGVRGTGLQHLGTAGICSASTRQAARCGWSHDLKLSTVPACPTRAIAAAPVIEGDLLIVQAAGRARWRVRFDKLTGRNAGRPCQTRRPIRPPS